MPRARARKPVTTPPQERSPAASTALAVLTPGELEQFDTLRDAEPATVEEADGWLLFRRCLSVDGRLVPPRSAPELTPEQEAALSEADRWRVTQARAFDRLAAKGYSDETLRGYGWHARQWGDWCDRLNIPPVPLDPALVAVHLMSYAFQQDPDTGEYLQDDDGGEVASVGTASITTRLAALNKLAVFCGVPQPGSDPRVTSVMRGIRRTLGTAKLRRKAAIDHAQLKALVAATGGVNRNAVRNRVALLMRARAAATALDLVEVTWFDVDLDTDHVVLRFAGKYAKKAREVRVPADPAHRHACLVAALTDLRAVTRADEFDAPILRKSSGAPLTRQAAHLLVSGIAAQHDLDWTGLPRASAARLSKITYGDDVPRSPLIAARDRALMLVTWHTALRRSNAVAFNWADVDTRPNGMVFLHVRRSKTDQEGEGAISRLAPSLDPVAVPCPVTALQDWRQALTDALGREPQPEEPIFCPISVDGRVKTTPRGALRRLSGASVNDIVQDLCIRVGLASGEGINPYGAHSLRAGFITEALRGDKLSIAEVQEVSRHKTVNVLLDYRRETQLETRNASSILMGRLGNASSETGT